MVKDKRWRYNPRRDWISHPPAIRGERVTKRAILLQALASSPSDVARLARGLEDAPANWRPDEAAWPPGKVINHLLAVEQVYTHHIRRVILEAEPLLPAIHPVEQRYCADDALSMAAARFRQAREVTLTTLQAVPAGVWQRAGIYHTTGRVTLRFMVQSLVEHDIEHTHQLVLLRQAWQESRALGVHLPLTHKPRSTT